jgi:hypothetical protein
MGTSWVALSVPLCEHGAGETAEQRSRQHSHSMKLTRKAVGGIFRGCDVWILKWGERVFRGRETWLLIMFTLCYIMCSLYEVDRINIGHTAAVVSLRPRFIFRLPTIIQWSLVIGESAPKDIRKIYLWSTSNQYGSILYTRVVQLFSSFGPRTSFPLDPRVEKLFLSLFLKVTANFLNL